MNVLFDSQAFDMQTIGGVSRSFVELYSHLPKDINARIGVIETDNVYLQNLGYPYRGYAYDHFIIKRKFPGKGRLFNLYNSLVGTNYWEDNYNINYCKKYLAKGKVDVFHPTYFKDWYLQYLGHTPFVLTIHDMIPELFPHYFREDDMQIRMKRKLVQLASRIIAVSENTKKDIISILGVQEDKIDVVYHGMSDCTSPFSKVSPYPEPYVLYVGDRYGYKNFKLFIESMSVVIKKHKELSVVCTGKPFSQNESDYFDYLGISGHIHQQFVNTDYDLINLYHHAFCFVYPSEYEGFGIPILEAYKAECPTLLNNSSCFHEIAGDAAIYFALSESQNSFLDVFEDFYNSTEANRLLLIEKQNRRLHKFNWEDSSKKLANVYKSVT